MAELSCDIVILGAGVLGLAVATELAARGADVRVIDPGDPNASAVAAGMIAPAFESLLDGADAARAALLRDAAALWPDVAAARGLSLDSTPAQWRGPDREGITDRLRALGFRADLSSEGVSAPDDIRIDPAEALVRLRDRLGDRPSPASATAVEQVADGWLVHTTAGRARCRTFVLATGATAPLLSLPPPAASVASVVRPIAGQIGFVARPLTDRVLRGSDGYVVPAGQGTLIGATMVEGQAPAEVDPAASARLIAMAATLLGHSIDAPVNWRAAVRGATPDGLPLAGPAGEGVHLALAPRRNGWLMAPLVARMVANGIEGRPRGAHAAALDPLRFTRPED